MGRFQSRHAKATIVQVCAHTEDVDEIMKDEFYNQLQDTMNKISGYDIKLSNGDMNAQLDDTRRGTK